MDTAEGVIRARVLGSKDKSQSMGTGRSVKDQAAGLRDLWY